MLISKVELRKEMLERRGALSPEERAEAAVRLTANALTFLAGLKFSAVAGYWPMRGEIDVLPLLAALHAQGKQCALPRITDNSRNLTFHVWEPQDSFVTGPYGVQEPSVVKPVRVPDIVLVPVVAFDGQGHRLGYGGGYYDTTLVALKNANPRLQAIGCAYDWQQLSVLPVEPHDMPLNHVLTDKSFL